MPYWLTLFGEPSTLDPLIPYVLSSQNDSLITSILSAGYAGLPARKTGGIR
jgi:hypothetical protein